MRMDIWVDFHGSGWLEAASATFNGYIAGQHVQSVQGYRRYSSGNNLIGTWDRWVGHDAAGGGSCGYSVNSSASYGGSAGSGTGYAGMTNFDFTPTAPTTVTATMNPDKSVTVTTHGSTAIWGGVHEYQIEVTTANQQAWSGDIRSGTAITWSGLQPGATYGFRARARSNEGWGPWAESTPVFVPSGGRRWDGNGFIPTQIFKRFDGNGFVTCQTVKRWDGNGWQNPQ